jgi:putative redox protein
VKVTVGSAGKVASTVRLDGHDLVFDQPANVPHGEGRGPSPLDVMLASVAGCAHYFASAYLMARGIATDAVRVEAEAEKSRQPVSRWSRVSIRVLLPPEVPQEMLPGVERAVRGCPAYGTLIHPPEVELTFEREERPRDEALRHAS